MGRMYSLVLAPAAVTVEATLAEIQAPADGVVKLHSVRVSQTTEEGDAAAEMLNISISRFSASGSGGNTAVTADPMAVGDPAFGGVCDTAHTTLGAGENALVEDAFNVQAGWLWVATPDEQIVVSPSGFVGVVTEAPSDSVSFTCTVVFEEIGG